MRFPFVSRTLHEEALRLKDERFADAMRIIDRQEAEIAELRKERKLYLDRIVWGYSGVKMYDDTPKLATVEEPEPKRGTEEEHVPSLVERAVAQVGGKARAVAKVIQAEHDKAYDEEIRNFFAAAQAEGKAAAKPEVKQ